ncbi:type I polyketide synthase [Nostoc sp. 'Lobaria pulmonaria (5183) cyanobiont']|uniref:type I polyketide synthase n=1 Tax=Nostoc sp. 'Lobaria pulmonaria (5183) cyanobiont' TaxID=1618022 RepID=UPI000CF31FB1|nr:type I polyketide synthase [Nostoc sp. 'Lobaria pulmonaria (5183) cyanobiont']AVH74386.1 polyketide synthase [Nostoc sp. 'Lobaria pulmonaria (5183) cyanobiont']
MEPIAIIGIGCRFPGANNPEAFWKLLKNGVDAIAEVQANRWDINTLYDPNPETLGKINNRWGGFLEQVDQFDPLFFGITPKEANFIDPQQRLLLEVAWEALENAGIVPDRLTDTSTGVFVGVGSHDYYLQAWRNFNSIGAYTSSGTSSSIVANRISYFFGLRGPSMAIDTACSSSLVAVHLACQSLWNEESTLAITGGVNLILSPEGNIGMTKAGALSPDGRCKTFDAKANGYVRGEGAGVVILKPLSQAKADGDLIYAVIRGSAINQDGRTNGLMAPNRWAQEALLREAYRRSGVSPGQVQYVEAHGTGTLLGDPIEMKALGSVLATERTPGNYCAVGSLKTNIGHLEAAAGIASLIKVALSLKHLQIPPSLHFQEPNPYIPFDEIPLKVQQTLGTWSEVAGAALAGVSSFGFGGTNVHLVLEEIAVQPLRSHEFERSQHLLTLSAKSETALQALAQSYETYLTSDRSVSLADVCFTANTGRSHFTHRLAVVAESAIQLAEQLGAFATGKETSRLVSGKANTSKHSRIVFLFTGQGSHYVNMGRHLYNTQPKFRQILDQCDELLRSYLPQPLLSVLYPVSDAPNLLDEAAYTQPALFALQYALAELWRSWGIVPDLVMGYSLGEYAAACVAGVFSLEDGLKLLVERGCLMQALPQNGIMAMVFADEVQVADAIAPFKDRVAIATLNAPKNITIAGEKEAVQSVLQKLKSENIGFQYLSIPHAFHSSLMEPMLDSFEQSLLSVQFQAPCIPLISNLTGQILQPGEIPDATYWRRHVREPVQFEKGMQTIFEQGYDLFIELGSHPILLSMGKRCLPKSFGTWLPSLKKGQDDWQILLNSLGALYTRGVNADWVGFDYNYPRSRLPLPTYPWQRERFWLEEIQPNQLTPKRSENQPFWESLVEAGRQQSLMGPLDLALNTYGVKSQFMDRLVTAYIVSAFHDLGVDIKPSSSYSADTLLHQFKILPIYRKLLHRWLERLAKEGFLQQQEEVFVGLLPLLTISLDSLATEAKKQWFDSTYAFDFMERCGQNLAAILVGEVKPVNLLFPSGSFETAEGIYQYSPEARYFNGIAKAVLESVVKTFSNDKNLRILEVGSGTGGTTASLLPVLPLNRTSYYYTDLSEFFFTRSQQKFQDYPFIYYGLLDIEQNPQEQGYDPHSFDVIVAANILHATQNLGETLQHIQSLLAPNGILLISEITEHQSWLDITFSLFEGWQRHDDEYRQDQPLLSVPQWKKTLLTNGFEEVIALPEFSCAAAILGQHILVARSSMSVTSPESCTSDDLSVQHLNQHLDNNFEQVQHHNSLPIDSSLTNLHFTQNSVFSTQPEGRQLLIEGYLREQVCKVLRLSPHQLDMQQSLNNLGVDSLMALDLKNQIEINLGIPVSITDLPSNSVSCLAMLVLEQLTLITTGDTWEEGEL